MTTKDEASRNALGKMTPAEKRHFNDVRNSIGLMKNEDLHNNYPNHGTAITVLEAHLEAITAIKQAQEPKVKLIPTAEEMGTPMQPQYSLDADPQGIRARVVSAVVGAMAYGASNTNKPPEGHWLNEVWDIARAEANRVQPHASEAVTWTPETGYVFAAAKQAEPAQSQKTWCDYVAGMIGTYLNEQVESDKCKAISGIIERRLWALPTPPEAA